MKQASPSFFFLFLEQTIDQLATQLRLHPSVSHLNLALIDTLILATTKRQSHEKWAKEVQY